jgi:dCTP diphosphatase
MRVSDSSHSTGNTSVPDRLDDLLEQLRAFRDERGWNQFHSPKNLAMALVAEAGEVAAELQWLTEDESTSARNPGQLRERLAGELADVMIYLTLLADAAGINLVEAAEAKIEVNRLRFPPS